MVLWFSSFSHHEYKSWVDRTDKSYQSTEWTGFPRVLLNSGDHSPQGGPGLWRQQRAHVWCTCVVHLCGRCSTASALGLQTTQARADLSTRCFSKGTGEKKEQLLTPEDLLILPQPYHLDVRPAWALSRRQAKHCLAIGFFAISLLSFGIIFLYNIFFAPSIKSSVFDLLMPLALFFILHTFDEFLLSSLQCTPGGTKTDLQPEAPSQTETVSAGLNIKLV